MEISASVCLQSDQIWVLIRFSGSFHDGQRTMSFNLGHILDSRGTLTFGLPKLSPRSKPRSFDNEATYHVTLPRITTSYSV